MQFHRIPSIIACIALLICLFAAILRQSTESTDTIDTAYSSHENVSDTVEVVDTTEILLDKRTFVCAGDIDLKVSDIGIVEFTCNVDGNKINITTNPQDIFVTKTYKKVLIGEPAEDEISE